MTHPKMHGSKNIQPSAFTSSPKTNPILTNWSEGSTLTLAQSVKAIRIKNLQHSH
jgi:hypothetical protein